MFTLFPFSGALETTETNHYLTGVLFIDLLMNLINGGLLNISDYLRFKCKNKRSTTQAGVSVPPGGRRETE